MSQNYSRLNGGEASPPPLYRSSDETDRQQQSDERDRLAEAFETSDDEGDDDDGHDNILDDDWEDDRANANTRSLNPFRRNNNSNNSRYQQLQLDSGTTLYDASSSGGEPSTSAPQEMDNAQHHQTTQRPLSGVRSWFADWRFNRSRSGGSSNNNDGVFANLTAKPDGSEKPGDDMPPSYEEAAADATPPYWETTIMTPGYGDELFIEGLPVGSPINFIWNMMVSAAFQFVGFFLTYLLHTSHAAKHGSRAGLGFTLLQCGYYLSPRDHGASGGAPSAPPGQFEPSDPNNPDVDPGKQVTGSFVQGHNSEAAAAAAAAASASASASSTESSSGNGWISTVLMIIGFIIIIKSVSDYFQARRMELAILQPNSGTGESEAEGETQSQPRTQTDERNAAENIV